MAPSRRQGKYWMLTIPKDDWEPNLPDGVNYIRGQLESGSDSGYLHWQVLALFSKKVSLPGVKQVFPVSSHAELTRSAASDAYVWKEDTRVADTQFEYGSRPFKRNSVTDWDRVWELAKSGRFEDVPSDIRLQHYRTLRVISSDYSEPSSMERVGYIFWGPTATGKSRRAWEEAGVDAYPKNPRTKWWDGYRGQESVVIDEFRGAIDVSYLLAWLDRYPVLLEIKGSSIPLSAKKIWITSNLDPESWYPGLDRDTYSALLRRFEIVKF